MKRTSFKLTALALFTFGAATSVIAQNQQNINAVTTAVPFLRISPDSRSSGMGETGIATSPDAYSPFFNNGKTPFNEKNIGIGVSYSPWFKDLNLNDVYFLTLSGYYKLDDMQAVNLGVRYFSMGEIQFTDNNGTNIGKSNPREYAVDLGYSRKLSDKSGIGIGLRYISSDLASGNFNGINYKKGSSVAGDIHYFHNGLLQDGSGFRWGATLSNLGSKVSYTNDAQQKDFIPANLGLGASYTKVFDEDNTLSFSLDVNKLLVPTPDDTSANGLQKYREKGVVGSWFSSFGDAPGGFSEEMKEFTVGAGAEFWYKQQFAVRAGYFYESPLKGYRQYVSVGAGLKYNVFGLNFAYLVPSGAGINRNPLSNTMRFSINFDLDGAGGSSTN